MVLEIQLKRTYLLISEFILISLISDLASLLRSFPSDPRPFGFPETEAPDDAAHQGGKVQDTRGTGRQSGSSFRIGRAVSPDFNLHLGTAGAAEAVGVQAGL